MRRLGCREQGRRGSEVGRGRLREAWKRQGKEVNTHFKCYLNSREERKNGLYFQRTILAVM